MSDEQIVPQGWVKINVEIASAEIISGSGFPKEYQGESIGDYPFAKVGDISKVFRAKQKYISSAGHFISEKVRSEIKARVFPKGAIVFPKIGEALKGNYRVVSSREMLFDNNVMAIIPDTKLITVDFFYYFLTTQDFGRYAVATAVPSVRRGDIASIEILLPSIDEQHRIVAKIEELFSELDKGIENLKTAQAQLKVYRQALLKHAFEGKLTAQWRAERNVTPAKAGGHPLNDMDSRLRGNDEPLETADTLLKRIQQERAQRYQQQLAEWETSGKQGSKPKPPKSLPPLTAEELAELPELPEGWGWVKVGNVSSVGTGITPLKGRSDFYANGSIPWVTSGALNDNFVTEASDYVTDLALKETNLRIYPKHTLLIALYGEGKTRGKCSELLIEATTNQAIAAIVQEGMSEKLRKYMKWFFQKNYGDIRLKSSGGVQPNLNLSIIENTLFPMCSIEEANQVVGAIEMKLSEVDQLNQTITTALQQAEALRQSILKKAFSGKLVPQDPSDEPASKLLARIRAEKAAQPNNKKGRL